MTSSDDQKAFEELELRVRTILPEEYQDSYQDVQPVSMGSASLKYGKDGKVAWNDIWDTFCDLAMAGGPPHKGVLLEPGSPAEIDAEPDRYREVVEEIRRGIVLTTTLPVEPFPMPGWVRIDCDDHVDAEWLVRAIVMENISARYEKSALYLPAGPAYRLEKEIKNVITAIAKTCHYWFDHTWGSERKRIDQLFAKMDRESLLIQPALPETEVRAEVQQALGAKIAAEIVKRTGLTISSHRYTNWLGVVCPSIRAAIWMMRAMVVSNVLSRREDSVLFIPVNPLTDGTGEVVVRSLERVYGFAGAQRIF